MLQYIRRYTGKFANYLIFIVICMLIIRVGMTWMGVNRNFNESVQFIYSATEIFLIPIPGHSDSLNLELSGFDLRAMIGIGVYIWVGFMLKNVVISFLEDNWRQRAYSLVSGLLEILWFVLFFRIGFEITGVMPEVGIFVSLIYKLTAPVYLFQDTTLGLGLFIGAVSAIWVIVQYKRNMVTIPKTLQKLSGYDYQLMYSIEP